MPDPLNIPPPILPPKTFAPPPAVRAVQSTTNDAALRHQAQKFEAAFLAEMLRHAGVARMPQAFNGGAGEQAFAGSLIQEYADRIAEGGGLGLADHIFNALKTRSRS